MTPEIHGHCSSQFENVKKVFAELYEDFPELGSSFSVYHQGELKVNLWAGVVEEGDSTPWQENTLVNVFSTGKGVAALCVQKAVDLGLIDLQKPVSYYWPEYGNSGKKDTLVAWFLNHKAGQPALKTALEDEAIYDWDFMVKTLAGEEPWWKPGTEHGYHMMTYGWLVGEVFRRACDMSINEFLQQEIAGPLGVEMAFGLSDEQIQRVSDVVVTKTMPDPGRISLFEKVMADPTSMTARSLMNPMSIMSGANSEQWRKAHLPAANLHATAGALATLYGKVACDEGVISAQAQQRCYEEQSVGEDNILFTRSRFGPGFMLQQPGSIEAEFGPGARAFGHVGSGGSMAFADPDQELGFAYTMNQMGPYVLVDPRPRRLIDAIYESIN